MSDGTICDKHGLHYGICHCCKKEQEENRKLEHLNSLYKKIDSLRAVIAEKDEYIIDLESDIADIKQLMV